MPEAKITLAVDGADTSVAAIERVKGALASVGGVSGVVQSAVGSIATSISTLGQDALRLVGAVNNINLAGKVEEVRSLDMAIQRMGTAGAGSVAELNAQMTAVGRATNQSEIAVQGLASSLGKATYDFRSALEAQKGLGEQALFTGRTPQEVQALGAALHNVLGVTGDTTVAIGKLNAQAQALGTVGGPAAFADTFVALAPTLQQTVSQMEGARGKAMAFVGAMTQGMRPDRAASMGGGVLGALQSNYFDINYTLGYDILDENGQVRDPAKVIRDLDEKARKRGLGKWQRMQALRSFVGTEGGTRLFHALERGDLSDERINEIAGLGPSGAAGAAAASYQGSVEGSAEAARLEQARNQRDMARHVKGWQDSMVSAFAEHPIAGAVGANLMVAGGLSAARFLPSAVRGGFGLMGLGAGAAGGAAGVAAGAGGAAVDLAALETSALWGGGLAPGGSVAAGAAGPLALAIAGLAAQVATLHSLGKNRDEMGKEWRAAHGIEEGATAEGDEEFSPYARKLKAEAKAKETEAKRAADPLYDIKQRMRRALDGNSGNADAAMKEMGADVISQINASPELRREWANLQSEKKDAAEVRDEARMSADEFSKKLRSDGPLPVVVVGTQDPPKNKPVAKDY